MTHAHPPQASLPRCPECGGAAGGEAFPRRWRWQRRLALLGVLLAWGGWVAWGLLGGSPPMLTSLTTPGGGYLYPINAVDRWLDHAETGLAGTDFYVKGVVVTAYPAWIPLPRDAPTEVALVANSVTQNTTPWTPSALRVEDLTRPGMTDAKFIAMVRPALAAAFGEAWDTPAQENIAWRVRVEGEDTIEIRQFRAPPGLGWTLPQRWMSERWFATTRIDLDWPAEPAWLRETPEVRMGTLWLRWKAGDVANRWWTFDLSFAITWRVAGVLALGLLAAWLLAPPIWRRRARKRWAKRGCCLGCGYNLVMEGGPT
ncbi:MAG: hypothetical protein AAFP26_01430 [Planctomycetota bacterium]